MNHKVILFLLNISLVLGARYSRFKPKTRTFHHHFGGGGFGGSSGFGGYGGGSGGSGGAGGGGSGSSGPSPTVSDDIATPPPDFDSAGYQPPAHLPAAPAPAPSNPGAQDTGETPANLRFSI